MNVKKINHRIRAKLEDWIKTLPEELREDTKNNIFVSGGCIVSMLKNEDVNDYDVYFTNREVARKVIEHYISSLNQDKAEENGCVSRVGVEDYDEGLRVVVKSAGALTNNETVKEDYQYFEYQNEEVVENYTHKLFDKKDKNGKYSPLLVTSNALTLDDDIQIITRFIGTPEEVHTYFDYVHCINYFTFSDGTVLNKDALESIVTGQLKYFGSKYPVAALFRMRKYLQRGWHINVGQIFKMAYDISKLDLDNFSVLQDQLIGVDVAYFHEVISKLKESKEIDRTYLFSLIEGTFEE